MSVCVSSINSTDLDTESISNQWKDAMNELDHMSTGEAFLALIYLVMPLVCSASEDQMSQQGNVMNVLSDLDTYRNRIETDFDEIQSSSSSEDDALAQDALQARQEMISELDANKSMFSSSFIDNVTQAVNSSTDNCSDTDIDGLAGYWQELWQENGNSSSSPDTSWSGLSPVTDPLNELSTDFNSQSSVAQTEYQYYENNEQEDLGAGFGMNTAVNTMINTTNSNMQSASS